MLNFLNFIANACELFFRFINPLTYFFAFQSWRFKKRRLSVSDFAHKHKHLLVIVLDPAEDTLYMSYRGRQVLNKIKTVDGKNHHIVKSVLKAGQFAHNIDKLIAALVEALKTPLNIPAVSSFFKWVDGALYNIVHAVHEDREAAKKIVTPKQKVQNIINSSQLPDEYKGKV